MLIHPYRLTLRLPVFFNLQSRGRIRYHRKSTQQFELTKFSLGDIKYGKTPFLRPSPSLKGILTKLLTKSLMPFLDAILEQDPKARVACETYVKTGMVLVGGEITTSAWVDIEEITRNTVREIGYVHSDMGFDANSCAVLSAIGKQSPDINQGR